MTGSSGGVTGGYDEQRPVEPRRPEAGPEPRGESGQRQVRADSDAVVAAAGGAAAGRAGVDTGTAADTGTVVSAGSATGRVPTAGTAPPAGAAPPGGTTPPSCGTAPAPAPRSAAGGAPDTPPEDGPPAAGPFGGAAPASPWLSAPGPAPGPPGIEPTTGAPFAMLPQRAPRATVPSGAATWGASPPAAAPGLDAEPDGDDDFWLPIEEVHWDGTPVQPTPRTWFGRPRISAAEKARPRPARPPGPPRHPAPGLAGALLLALLASFFAWVSAEPFWLAVGHGDRGTATVTGCAGVGIGQHCRGDFSAVAGGRTVRDVRLVGVGGDSREAGSRMSARMVPDSQKAYVGAGTALLHLRWALGLALVLVCAIGTGWVTGALRLADRRARRRAALVSVAGPLLLAAGFLTAAY
ncbi:hypothetical protein [Plantactinospora sp. CA-290183]|uniref:hypothetical protein n=1 Tax=Plantactinospora sp. CA-290183 TaxID=3240006 RepID=UPI003D90A2EB